MKSHALKNHDLPVLTCTTEQPLCCPLKISLLGRNMSKYFPYKEISQKCHQKTIWEKPLRKDFFTPSLRGVGEEDRRKCGRGKKGGCCGQEGGMGMRGERRRGLRNADPFPRWPLDRSPSSWPPREPDTY